MKLLFSLLALSLSSSAFAIEGPYDALKKVAVAKFLADSNNANSNLGKIIAKEIEDTKDGRNENGSIAMPVKAGAFQVVMINGEEIYNPARYMSRNEETHKCVGSGNSATFLISLPTHVGVHAAAEDGALLFTVGATYEVSFTITNKDPDVSCQEMAEDAQDFKGAYIVGDFTRSEVTPVKN